jgi:exopolysaccharide biosynthesis polyprenyl glycosylphosphotransferase
VTGAMNLPLIDQTRGVAAGVVPATGLASSHERLRLRLYIAQMVSEAVAIVGAYVVADALYLGIHYLRTHSFEEATLASQLLLPIYFTIALHNGTYSLASLKDWHVGATRAVASLAISAALLFFVIFFVRLDADFSHTTFVIAVVIAAAMITALRRAVVRVTRQRWGPHASNVLVIDDGGPSINLPSTFYVNAAEHGLTSSLDDPHALDLLARYVRNMDQVIVSCAPDRRVEWAMVLKGSGVHGEILSEFMREVGALGVIHHPEIETTTVLVSSGPLGLRARATKRLFDVGASVIALMVACPILLIAALAIKLEDGGPVMFRQKRIGRRNQLFSIYKLRTMKVDRADRDGNRSTGRNDDRVTRVGKFLRRTSIDELPQLFNVLKGEMSLVGPRPHAIGSLAGDKLFWEVDQRYWQRHSLRPGLTGLAQIRGFRGATDLETDLTSRLQADLEYITGWTIWRDLRILLATTMVLWHDRAF